ncbi:hypothetical protein MLD38_019245 [Melastoma candidum]|uniref:Uncharacterized protein n=1 Tax=Melastoma candidum TaxID=119954 RepID=A0ACB9QWD6_9MYRT|nr:hypothetical protein MLD38_019245 [Melastoma candidum]
MTPRATAPLPLFLLLLYGSAASRSFIALQCPEELENYPLGSKYLSNLSRLLLQLVYAKGQISFFYNVTEGEPPDTVYGQYLCRPDVTGDLCLSCINFGSAEILTACPGRKGAIIWYDECLIRYSNRSFFSVMESAPSYLSYLPATSSYPDIFGTTLAGLVQNTTDSAIDSDTHYATTCWPVLSFLKMYVRAQCMPDQSKKDCRLCFTAATSNIGSFNSMKQSARIYLPSCYLRYEISDSRSQAPSPGPAANRATNSKGGRRKTSVRKWIVTSAVAGFCLVTIFSGLCVLAKLLAKISEDKQTGKAVWSGDQSKGLRCQILNDESRPETSVNNTGDKYSMQLHVILMATSNFSDDCKLGQGGFGPVYKGTLADGREIAVKRLSRTSCQGLRELKNEATLIAELQHRNLVKLLGSCIEEHEKLLIYEYMPNKSLDFFLFGTRLLYELRFPDNGMRLS